MFGSTAARVREAKERNPEQFCSVPSCLWRTVVHGVSKPCRKHPIAATAQPVQEPLFVSTIGICTCENNGDYCEACQVRLGLI